MGGITDFNFDV